MKFIMKQCIGCLALIPKHAVMCKMCGCKQVSDADFDAHIAAAERITQLESAIRNHRDQRGDDRCWLDDAELYAVIDSTQADFKLPPRQTFLQNCSRYWECRQKSTDKEEALRVYRGGL